MADDVNMNDATQSDSNRATADPALENAKLDKITILPGASSDGTAASFQIKYEDHTLGNTLRFMIMKNPDVEFCGYSIPHPSESQMHLRVQTYGETTAIEAFRKGLSDLIDVCDVVEKKFRDRVAAGEYSEVAP